MTMKLGPTVVRSATLHVTADLAFCQTRSSRVPRYNPYSAFTRAGSSTMGPKPSLGRLESNGAVRLPPLMRNVSRLAAPSDFPHETPREVPPQGALPVLVHSVPLSNLAEVRGRGAHTRGSQTNVQLPTFSLPLLLPSFSPQPLPFPQQRPPPLPVRMTANERDRLRMSEPLQQVSRNLDAWFNPVLIHPLATYQVSRYSHRYVV